jgi:hypothetical protein
MGRILILINKYDPMTQPIIHQTKFGLNLKGGLQFLAIFPTAWKMRMLPDVPSRNGPGPCLWSAGNVNVTSNS